MPNQWPDDRPEGRGVFVGCWFSILLLLAILIVWAVFRWLI